MRSQGEEHSVQNNRIQELENKIKQARNDYYNDQPTVSDKVYDAWVDELRLLDPSNMAVTAIGAPVVPSEWKKAKHQMPMGSLDKVNSPAELSKWTKDIIDDSDELFVTEKLDGLSIEVIYDEGKLVQAITRGDGETGEDITVNVAKMKGVASQLKGNTNSCQKNGVVFQQPTFTGSLRGEIIMTKSIHKKYFSDKANPRNAASGVSKRLDSVGVEHLDIIFYQALGNIDFSTEVSQFKWLKSQGVSIPNYWLMDDVDEVSEHWRNYQDTKRDSLDYDIDGLVVRINDLIKQAALGDKDLRPKGAIAFKFDNESRETTLLDVDWQVGNSGRVTPVAILKPVILCGAEIKRASLHNVNFFNSLKLFKGCRVLVSRRNDVIPYIEENIDIGNE